MTQTTICKYDSESNDANLFYESGRKEVVNYTFKNVSEKKKRQ